MASDSPLSFAKDIFPLFTDADVSHMKPLGMDLSSHDDSREAGGEHFRRRQRGHDATARGRWRSLVGTDGQYVRAVDGSRLPAPTTASMNKPAWRAAKIVERRSETPTASTLVFDISDWPGHVAGQHVVVRPTMPDGTTPLARSRSGTRPTVRASN